MALGMTSTCHLKKQRIKMVFLKSIFFFLKFGFILAFCFGSDPVHPEVLSEALSKASLVF